MLGLVVMNPANACGFGEAPDDCGQTDEGNARYLLLRVVNALKADKTKVLESFQRGSGGFRTQDTYVFCVGPDGIMTAHPNPALQSHDVRDLHDSTGNYFIAAMMKAAEPGKVASIRYLFPKPGQTEAVPKTTFYTRAVDQVCGVGVYDGDTNPAPAGPLSRQERIAALRRKISDEVSATARADWAEYLQLSDEVAATQEATIAKVRAQVQAIDASLVSERWP